jgi:hypothetical protein
LERFRKEFGRTRELPSQPVCLFGMGLQPKFLYKAGTLFRADSGAVFPRWEAAEEVILPPDNAVVLRPTMGDLVRLRKDELGFWIEDRAGRERVPGTDRPVRTA